MELLTYDEKSNQKIASGQPFKGFRGEENLLSNYTRNSHLGYQACLTNPYYHEANQLFDLVNDPEEKLNVFTAIYPKAKEMQKLLRKDLTTFGSRPFGDLTN